MKVAILMNVCAAINIVLAIIFAIYGHSSWAAFSLAFAIFCKIFAVLGSLAKPRAKKDGERDSNQDA